MFSPRMRGCSFYAHNPGAHPPVFPAYAGMFRSASVVCATFWSFPRVCGDVPMLLIDAGDVRWFSPRMRGCSSKPTFWKSAIPVFPAYAGMFLKTIGFHKISPCFPRVCGDVPWTVACTPV